MIEVTIRPVQAIVFDLDGVLIDSEPLMRFAFETCYRQYIGDGPAPIERYLEHMGESFPRIMDHLGLPHSLWQPYRELCQQHIDRIRVFPESRTLLTWAVEQGLKLAILTGKDRQRTLHLLQFFGLEQFFDVVIASDELSQPKPDPEGMVCALEALQCAPEAAVMVGDAVSDVLCAQRAGVRAIAVTWGIKPERVQTLCRPDYLVHSWAELTALAQHLTQSDEVEEIKTRAGYDANGR
ncbi:MAG TPA: HAD-IA family hydrolase [Herpetosiphonaceae bacterium]